MAQQTYLLPGFDSSVNSMNDFATAPTPFGAEEMGLPLSLRSWYGAQCPPSCRPLEDVAGHSQRALAAARRRRRVCGLGHVVGLARLRCGRGASEGVPSTRAPHTLTCHASARSPAGVNFSAGLPYLPTYADAWQIDTGICLLGGNGQVRPWGQRADRYCS